MKPYAHINTIRKFKDQQKDFYIFSSEIKKEKLNVIEWLMTNAHFCLYRSMKLFI